MSWKRLLGLFAVLGSLLVPSFASADSACPGPRTCGAYQLMGHHWAHRADGSIHIPYYINPTQHWMSSEEFIGAIKAAARVWTAADPRVHFDFQGTTDAVPGPVSDGKSVFGAGVVPAVSGLGATYTGNADGGQIQEADVAFALTAYFEWDPCQQKDNSCGRPARTTSCCVWFADLQGVATHELGHVLGLDHPAQSAGEELTMTAVYDQLDASELRYQTLGLGDIRGVRALYPCHCPMPHVYVP